MQKIPVHIWLIFLFVTLLVSVVATTFLFTLGLVLIEFLLYPLALGISALLTLCGVALRLGRSLDAFPTGYDTIDLSYAADSVITLFWHIFPKNIAAIFCGLLGFQELP